MMTATRDRTRPLEGAVLVRIATVETEWFRALPSVPEGRRVGLTLGRAESTDATTELHRRGYDLVGVVTARGEGAHADVFVSAELRTSAPRWYASLLLPALRVFDLRFGPVHLVLRAEIDAHLAAIERLHPADTRASDERHRTSDGPADEDHR
jgi:hypothetical protein